MTVSTLAPVSGFLFGFLISIKYCYLFGIKSQYVESGTGSRLLSMDLQTRVEGPYDVCGCSCGAVCCLPGGISPHALGGSVSRVETFRGENLKCKPQLALRDPMCNGWVGILHRVHLHNNMYATDHQVLL